MRRFAIAVFVVALGLFAASWADAAKSDTVTIALSGEPPTMDPHRTSNFIGTMVWRWSYDSLLTAETGTGKVIPWLAEKWEKIDGSKTVKFWLRKDANFADGSPVTSQAVAYTMTRVMSSARQRPYFRTFDRIEIIDDKTFIWHNKVHDNGMFNRITRWGGIISMGAKGKDKPTISRKTFGSGPYILKSWTKGNKMVFTANPTWWGNKIYPKRPKTLVLRRISESATRVKSLLNGEMDIIWGVMPQFVKQIQDNPKTDVSVVPAVRIMFMSFFSSHGGPMANRKVRLAINYALDAEAVRTTILGGRADLFGQILHPWNFSGYNPNKKWYGYDPAKAKKLLKEAGYPKGFKMEIIATNGRYPGDKATCEASAGMLRKVGIQATCNSQRFPLFKKMHRAYKAGKRKGAGAYYMGFGNGAGESGLVMKGTSGCKGAWSGHCFKDLDKAIADAVAIGDPAKQQAAFEGVTDKMKQMVTHKIFVKIHDVLGYNKRLNFTARHDETLYAWEIEVK